MNNKENLTREYIIKAFCKLLENKKYDNVSVCDIADKAGVSRMSFYRNFKSKEDLTFAFLDELSDELKSNIETMENINQFIVAKYSFEIFKKYSKTILSLTNSSISKVLASEILQRFSTNVPHDYMNKTSKYIPIYYFGAIVHVLIEWLLSGMKESTDDMARLICSLNGLNNCKNDKI